jgi:hypothetical protein
MTTIFVRDAAATAVIFGFFASVWFGWAQEKPPPRWRGLLIAGSVASLVTMVAGALLTWRFWRDGSAFDADTSRAFGIVVGVELVAAAAGAIVLTVRRRADLVAAWVALIVGLHLFPVAAIVGYGLLYLVAAAVTAVALIAVPVARSRSVPVSAVTGMTTGSVLLVAALASLAYGLVMA